MPEPPKNPPLPVGTMTYWGKISAVGWVGERYYWITNKDGLGVAMMPADVVEPDFTRPGSPAPEESDQFERGAGEESTHTRRNIGPDGYSGRWERK